MSEDFLSLDDERAVDDGRGSLALAIGIAAGLAAGGLWAALVFVTDMEIGYAAWGVGGLVGFAMSRVTTQRTQKLAYAAAAFALLGLVAGKAFIFAASAGQVAKDFGEDPEFMKGAVAWQMYAERTLDQATLDEVDRSQAGPDTLSDAAWESMLEQADARLASMTDAERQAVATATAHGVMQQMGVIGGIRAQLTMFDLLWVLLAVGTAYRMLAPAKHEVAAEVEQI